MHRLVKKNNVPLPFLFFWYLTLWNISESSAVFLHLPKDKAEALELSQSFSRDKLIKRIIKSLTYQIQQLDVLSYMSEYEWI